MRAVRQCAKVHEKAGGKERVREVDLSSSIGPIAIVESMGLNVIFRFDDFELDTVRRELRQGDRLRVLQPRVLRSWSTGPASRLRRIQVRAARKALAGCRRDRRVGAARDQPGTRCHRR